MSEQRHTESYPSYTLNPETTLLKEAQAADLLNWNVKTLQKRRWQGKEPKFLKMGRSVRYRLSDLLEFLNKCEQGALTSQA